MSNRAYLSPFPRGLLNPLLTGPFLPKGMSAHEGPGLGRGSVWGLTPGGLPRLTCPHSIIHPAKTLSTFPVLGMALVAKDAGRNQKQPLTPRVSESVRVGRQACKKSFPECNVNPRIG